MSSRPPRRRRASGPRKGPSRLTVEGMEPRQLLATFFVTTTVDSGAGSFREAIIDANEEAGPDLIDFSRMTSGQSAIITAEVDLPDITGPARINGWSHPDYVDGSFDPVVRIDGNNGDVARGLNFVGLGASNSEVRGLSITGFRGNGITVLDADGLLIYGNHIGVDLDGGTAVPNGQHGIYLENSSGNRIGTTESANINAEAAGNIISNNGSSGANFSGIAIVGDDTSSINNRISRNSINNNANLGIDLGNDGVTPNDPAPDQDLGPNRLQNTPVLSEARTIVQNNTIRTEVDGTIQSVPNTRFEVQFFGNDSGGQGARYIGRTFVTTDDQGLASFNAVTFAGINEQGSSITATAIDPDGNTSEFSAARPTQFFTDQIDLGVTITDTPDPVLVGDQLTIRVTITNKNTSIASLPVDLVTFLPSNLAVLPSQINVSNDVLPTIDQNNVLTWCLGSLAPGATEVLTLTPRPAVPGLVTLRVATIGGSSNDTNPNDNTAQSTTVVSPNPNVPILSFRVRDYSVGESGGTAPIAVIRSNALSGEVTVDYRTIDGTATAGTDYESSLGTLTFGTNEQIKTFTIPIIDDNEIDPNRTVILELTNPSTGAIVGIPNRATLTIFDDDPTAPEPQFLQFASASTFVQENEGQATIIVRRTGGSTGVATVPFATVPGTAIPDRDYTSVSGTLTFNSGEVEKAIVVPIIDNAIVDGSRAFSVTLGEGTGAAPGEIRSTQVTIVDNESPPAGTFQFSMADFTANEADGSATITVTRTGGMGPATITFETVPGTAQPGVRYQPTSGTLEFGPDDTQKTFTVTLIDSPEFIGPQTVLLKLGASPGASLGPIAQATLTIVDDETPPVGIFQFESSVVEVDESAGVARIRVLRTGGAFDTVSIGVATAAGDAVPNVDFRPVAVRLTFGPGETEKVVEIPIIDNTAFDAARGVGVFLGFPEGNAVIGEPGAVALVIRNNDADPSLPAVSEVADVRAIGIGGAISGLAVHFNKPMDATSTLAASNYVVVAHGRDGVLGTPDDRAIPITDLARSADGLSVAVSLASPVPAGEFVTIGINGSPGGLTDISGSLLDGDGDGVAGGNFSTSLVRASRLTYRDTDGDLITYAATGGGFVEVVRGAPGVGDIVRVIDGVPFRTVLRGQVVRQRGGDGVAFIRRIEGIDPFGRVRSALRTLPFIDLSQISPEAVDALLASQARRLRR